MKMWALGVVIVLMISAFAAFAGATETRANTNFSPSEVWTTNMNSNIGMINTTESMDANGDGLAEVMVTAENYSSNAYSVYLLNGADGGTMNKTYFTDVGYAESGDVVGEDGTLYGITILDNQGNPMMDHHFMIFGNHSNNKRVSVYSVDYPSLKNISYRGIDIPSTINTGITPVTVNAYNWIFHVIAVNNEPYLVYFGVYAGSALGQTVNELQIIVMNKTLNIVWEKTEKMISSGGLYPFGVDLIDFNGLGVIGGAPTILFANITSNPGNTTLIAYDTSNGNVVWETNITGTMPILDPLGFFTILEGFNAYAFDYNGDNKTDIMIGTYSSNYSYLNFVGSSGNILGYYMRGKENISAMATHTDMKVGPFHKLVNSVDVNNDGNGEVLFVDNNTNLVCWDVAQNSTVWKLNLLNQSYNYAVTLSTNDLTGDGVWDLYLMGMNETYVNGVKTKKVNLTAINAVNGQVIWSKYYTRAISGFVGNGVIKEISDMNNDGLQDSLVVYGYYNDGSSLYVNVSAISGDGTTLWTSKVSLGVNSNDFKNWSSTAGILGDINNDGYSDTIVKLYYDNGTDSVDTYIKILSGKDGSLLWSGEVTGDSKDMDIFAFITLKTTSSWDQFDYNHDGITNEILITTAHSVQIYAVTQAVPEFNPLILFVFLPIVVFFAVRRH